MPSSVKPRIAERGRPASAEVVLRHPQPLNLADAIRFRSDRLPYARLGIPSLMYITDLHGDSHTAGDIIAYLPPTRLH